MTTPPSRRLSRHEINLLKHLLRFSPIGIPIAVPRKFRDALVPLWRNGLIEIWYRLDRDSADGRQKQFVSLTIDGWRRIDAIIHAGNIRRASGVQGQRIDHDQSSTSEQED